MRFVRQSQRPASDNHLIPLINVIFLMLIFFMVVGQISPREPFRVDPPVSEQQANGETRDRVIVLDADGRMAVGDRILSSEALTEQLAAWKAAAGGADRIRVTLKADAAVTSAKLRETLDLLEAAGIPRIELITRAAGRS
ncbi:ExbD/TolR family protein [Imhoffiella purpurea]|uniref:Biopolymer transport protein ExbD/TolR n=1 Tax=Imhoffiella purpurea TaxID=1249627 RepID=W9V3V7_9GAMM|nr:biopolymer transporter ExbD [Imhoffiella purpurea]EXJ14203.1 Biopolymer transport protein ExbD/TolR [Imhoffiella purpurea]